MNHETEKVRRKRFRRSEIQGRPPEMARVVYCEHERTTVREPATGEDVGQFEVTT